MSSRDQLSGKLFEIVDLSVVNHDHGTVFIEKRLMTSAQVDDREPPMSKTYPRLQVNAGVIRSTMSLYITHSSEHILSDGTSLAAIKLSGYTAHSIS
jgi:hypothetical protein